MNGGTTLPVRIARPTSSHSLPEYPRTPPTYLAPHPHRRPRTPRSSPLALSSYQASGETTDEQASQKPRYRPNRISSTPDIAVPVQSLYDSDATLLSSASSSQLSSLSGITVASPFPPMPISSSSSTSGEDEKENVEAGSIFRSIVKRLSIVSTSSLATSEKEKDEKTERQRSSFILHSTSTTSLASSASSHTFRTDRTSHTAPPMPTIPRWALNAMREEEASASRDVKYFRRRGTSDAHSGSLGSLPNQPIPRVVRVSSPSQPRPHSVSVSRDPSENWMSFADPTPRFSRLGLAGDGVVLPVKKKESLAKMKSAGSIRSTADTASVSQPPRARHDSGFMNKSESSPAIGFSNDSDAVNVRANPMEKQAPRKRDSLASLSMDFPRIAAPSPLVGSENVPPTAGEPIPPARPRSPLTTVSPSPSLSRRSAILKRDSRLLVAINENQPLSSPSPDDDAPMEFGRRTGDVPSQETREVKTIRKGIKQIVMRITTSPMSSSNKLKLTTFHDAQSTPVVVLEPPPSTRFGKPASSSVPSLPFVKEFGYRQDFSPRQSDFRGKKRFKTIRKGWKAIFGGFRR